METCPNGDFTAPTKDEVLGHIYHAHGLDAADRYLDLGIKEKERLRLEKLKEALKDKR
jgi:hypothetical protein